MGLSVPSSRGKEGTGQISEVKNRVGTETIGLVARFLAVKPLKL